HQHSTPFPTRRSSDLVQETTGLKQVSKFRGHPRGTAALAFSPDGKLLAERGGDGTIRLYDPEKGTELRQLAVHAANTPLPAGVVDRKSTRLNSSHQIS